MVSKVTEELLKLDLEHVIHPACPVGINKGIIFERGSGVILTDTEGKEYIDCSAQLSCVNLGYGRSYQFLDVIAEQMEKVEYTMLFLGYSHPAVIKYSQKLAEVTPQGVGHFFFTSGGSESNDTAYKIARLSKKRSKIISLYDSYHGVTLGSITATGEGKGAEWAGIGPLLPDFIHIPSYYCYRCAFGEKYPDCNLQCARLLAHTIEREGPKNIAAFIAEPILGVGGAISPPPEYWPMVRKICTDYDVLLIVDEVMTGFGRTGKFFAVEHWGIKPDMMIISKGISSTYFPFSVVAISDEVFNSLKGVIISGFTNSGHPIGCAIASKVLDIYKEEKVVENSAKVGKYTLDRLNAEFSPLPCVGNIEGKGLFIAMEIVRDKATRAPFDPKLNIIGRIEDQARENGLIIRSNYITRHPGDRVRLTPPLTISTQEIDRALDILYPVLADIKAD